MRLLHRLPVLFIILLYSCGLFALTGPMKSTARRGGIVVMPLSRQNAMRPKAFYQRHRVMVLKKSGRWWAVVGIPMLHSIKPLTLTVYSGKKRKKLPIKMAGPKVKKKKIIKKKRKKRKPRIQRIRIKNRELVSPNSVNKARAKREALITKKIIQRWRYVNHINLRFKRPVRGKITSYFGVRRIYNGRKRSWHRGIDFAGKRGTRVRASAAGVVARCDNYFYSGKIIFIDHGQGLISFYAHLNKILVRKGQRVKRGQVIGTIGSTGRSTAPHLHWGVALNQVRVNPLLFL